MIQKFVRHLRMLLLGALLAAAPALAQAPAAPAPAAAAATDAEAERQRIAGLVATLKDEAARARLVGELELLLRAQEAGAAAEAAAPGLGGRALGWTAARLAAVGEQMGTFAATFADLPAAGGFLARRLADPGERWALLRLGLGTALALALGALARAVATRLLGRPRRGLAVRAARAGARRWWARLPFALAGGALGLLPVAAFALAAYAALAAVRLPANVAPTALALVHATVLLQAALALGRLVFDPRRPALRLARLADSDAAALQRWLGVLAGVAVYGWFLAGAVRLAGWPPAAELAFAKLLGLALTVAAVGLVLRARRPVADWLQPDHPGDGPVGRQLAALRSRLAAVWHVPAALYLAALYVVAALDIPGGAWFIGRATLVTLAVLALARPLANGGSRLLLRPAADDAVEAAAGLADADANADGRLRRYRPLLARLWRGAVWAAALLLAAAAWGAPLGAWLASGPGARIAGSALSIALAVAGALAVWEVANAAIARALARDGDGGAHAARLRTLLPLLRNALMIVLAVLVGLIALSELGVDIAPLLAGAGIVGLAVGFGAQTLVKDIITGLFVVVEGSIAVGDVVEAGGHGGLVESMTIRTLRLRDFDGSVHTVPFSEVTSVVNRTRDFGQAVLDIGISYRESIDDCVAVIRRVAEEMRADPHFGPMMVAEPPIEIHGVEELADSAVVIKARIKTPPLMQWEVGRHFRWRLKNRFDELGIEIPYPHRTLYFGVDKAGRAPAARVALAGAEAAGGPLAGAAGTDAAAPPPAADRRGERA
ncbi:MAG TPA: mechanosensitive ion channel domain-containing protein [Alphaproteobacteria bacterium]|nr:mechanosensitive ion channel domain-containing protein [Alphaproteobacteria bacterium]